MKLPVFLVALPLAAADLSLVSPDGRVAFQLSWQTGSRLEYSVAFGGKPAVESSSLGIVVDGVNLAEGVEASKSERYEVDESYPSNARTRPQ